MCCECLDDDLSIGLGKVASKLSAEQSAPYSNIFLMVNVPC